LNHSHKRQLRYGRSWARYCFLVPLLILTTVLPVESSIQAYHRSFGPKSALLVSSPTLSWEVWPSEGSRVTSATMLVNGESVSASYDESTRRLTYRPEKPLLAGPYKVQCKVVVDGRLVVTKDWTFQVSTNATPVLPEANADQQQALAIANGYRRPLGLEDMVLEPRLNAASLAHANYLAKNHRTGHYEKEGEPGFIGATPDDRLEAFGYTGGSWECVTYNSGGVSESVRDLFHAPYHRIPFLQPGHVPFGSGFAGKNLSIKFGESGEMASEVSPGVNQEGVPTSWDGNESPNPLRMHPSAAETVGYPIVFAHFAEGNPSLKLVKATLTLDGQSVDCFIDSPENDDHLENAVILIPKRPLQAKAQYSAHVEVVVAGKRSVSRDWTFTTGAK